MKKQPWWDLKYYFVKNSSQWLPDDAILYKEFTNNNFLFYETHHHQMRSIFSRKSIAAFNWISLTRYQYSSRRKEQKTVSMGIFSKVRAMLFQIDFLGELDFRLILRTKGFWFILIGQIETLSLCLLCIFSNWNMEPEWIRAHELSNEVLLVTLYWKQKIWIDWTFQTVEIECSIWVLCKQFCLSYLWCCGVPFAYGSFYHWVRVILPQTWFETSIVLGSGQ